MEELTWSFSSISETLMAAIDEACFSAVTPIKSTAAATVRMAAVRRERKGILLSRAVDVVPRKSRQIKVAIMSELRVPLLPVVSA